MGVGGTTRDEFDIEFWATIGGFLVGVVSLAGSLFRVGPQLLWLFPGLAAVGAMYYGLRGPYGTWRQFREWEITADGRLYIGGTRNVTLRADTVQKILDSYRRRVDVEFDDHIKEVGAEIGRAFVDDWRQDTSHPAVDDATDDPETLRTRIELYFEYDSGTGIGNYELVSNDLTDADGTFEFVVEISNTFLTYPAGTQSTGQGNQCTLIAGILEGVLSKLLGVTLDVTETSCAALEGDSCRFRVAEPDD